MTSFKRQQQKHVKKPYRVRNWAEYEAGLQRRGNLTVWFEVADEATIDATIGRASGAGSEVVERPRWNPLAHHYEATLADPDGYVVMVNTPFTP